MVLSLLPRRRLRQPVRPSALALAAALGLVGCGGAARTVSVTLPARTPSGPTPAAPAPAARPIALGITEQNPAFYAPGTAPPGFGAWRDALAAVRPDYLRILVDWSTLQPSPDQPADLAQARDGCSRGISPCAPYAGLKAELIAARAAQQAYGGFQVVMEIYGAPGWAATPAGGCERAAAKPNARAYSAAGLAGYAKLIGGIRALGAATGVKLGWWAPFNEPNQPAFISPQRETCDGPSRSPGMYAQIVRTAQKALAGSGAKLVLGELAGVSAPSAIDTGVGEFIRALPDDVACAASVWSQHEYASPRDAGTSPPLARDTVREAEAALAARPCTAKLPLWVSETGVGGPRAGQPQSTTAAALATQCAGMAVRLERWAADPQVEAVFQYTLRDDPVYPVGWADPSLNARFPVYELWRAWAEARGAPPARPAGCGAP